MNSDKMITRFEGADGRRRLIEQLRLQVVIGGDAAVAAEIANVATILEVSGGQVLIRQDAADNDLFLIISGALRIVVNGRDVAIRCAGEHVGEMAIVDPSAARSASVVAAESSIVARITEPAFIRIAESRADLWRALAVQLSRRLNEGCT